MRNVRMPALHANIASVNITTIPGSETARRRSETSRDHSSEMMRASASERSVSEGASGNSNSDVVITRVSQEAITAAARATDT